MLRQYSENEAMIKKVFGYQIWHLVSVIILIAVMQKLISINHDTTNGELWGISTKAWFWIAIVIWNAAGIFPRRWRPGSTIMREYDKIRTINFP